MKKLVLLALLIPTLGLSQLYKSIDEQGNTIYSDIQPDENATELILPPLNISETPKKSRYNTPSAKADEASAKTVVKRYSKLSIIQPINNEAIRSNDGSLIVAVQLAPRLFTENGDRLLIELDGQVVNENSRNNTKLKNIDRGSHTINAYVLSAKGKRLTTAQSVTFHLKRAIASQ
jgi:hypothetical protein